MNVAYIGLGSNLGQSIETLRQALDYLSTNFPFEVPKISSFYRSKPLDCEAHENKPQPDYINAVATIKGDFSPLELLDILQVVEIRFGRVRGVQRWASRTLDLDILLFDDLQISEKRLTIPHPGILQRDFVIYPLAEIAPELEIPGFGPIKQAISTCKNRDLEKIHDDNRKPKKEKNRR